MDIPLNKQNVLIIVAILIFLLSLGIWWWEMQIQKQNKATQAEMLNLLRKVNSKTEDI